MGPLRDRGVTAKEQRDVPSRLKVGEDSQPPILSPMTSTLRGSLQPLKKVEDRWV